MAIPQKLQGDVAHIAATTTLYDLVTAYDFTNHEIIVQDPQGRVIADVLSPDPAIIHDDTGLFHYDFPIPLHANVGIWFVFWSAVGDDGLTSRQIAYFEVIAS